MRGFAGAPLTATALPEEETGRRLRAGLLFGFVTLTPYSKAMSP